MSDARIDRLLNDLVPPFQPSGDWNDVLLRARPWRQRALTAAAVVAVAVLAPVGIALGGKLADLFRGTPAPPAVSTSFQGFNRFADALVQRGFADKFPHVDVSKAHGVIEVKTSGGPEDLWAAPSESGGLCWFVDFADDPPGPDGQYGFGGCDGSLPRPSKISWGTAMIEPHPSLVSVYGRVYADAVGVRLEFADGSTATLPVVEGFFLGSFEKGASVSEVSALDAAGRAVAHDRPGS
jgi:hypothetical protein